MTYTRFFVLLLLAALLATPATAAPFELPAVSGIFDTLAAAWDALCSLVDDVPQMDPEPDPDSEFGGMADPSG